MFVFCLSRVFNKLTTGPALASAAEEDVPQAVAERQIFREKKTDFSHFVDGFKRRPSSPRTEEERAALTPTVSRPVSDFNLMAGNVCVRE